MIEQYYVTAGKATHRWVRCVGTSETVHAPATGYWLDALASLRAAAVLPSTIAEIDIEIVAQKRKLSVD